MRACVLFPGQGFQKFGMLAKLAGSHPAIVDPIVQTCDETLPDLRLSRLLLGDDEPVDVTPTELAQPLLLAHGIAHYKVWSSVNQSTDVKFAMGHSLGEYTSLVAAGLLPLSEGLKLVRSRGLAMQEASIKAGRATGMTIVIKPRQIGPEKWSNVLSEVAGSANVDIAAYNSSSLTVLSGDKISLKKAIDALKADKWEFGPKARILAKPLPVSAAFHSRYMQPAAEALSGIIAKAEWQALETAKFSVVSNISGKPYSSIEEIKQSCVAALTNPVRWMQSVKYVEDQGVDEFVAMGGDVHKLMEKDVGIVSKLFE